MLLFAIIRAMRDYNPRMEKEKLKLGVGEMRKYKRALIIGASGGIGGALAASVLADETVTLSRSADGFDLTDERTVEAAAARLEGEFDLIVDATGALEIDGIGPEKSLRQIDPAVMAAQFSTNAIGPALIFKHFMRRLPRGDRAVLATLSARVGSIGDNGLGGWVSYRAAKAALNQIVRTTSIELARTHPEAICVALHPGTVKTPLTDRYVGNHPTVSPDEAAQNLLVVLDQLQPENTGGFYDWAGKEVPW